MGKVIFVYKSINTKYKDWTEQFRVFTDYVCFSVLLSAMFLYVISIWVLFFLAKLHCLFLFLNIERSCYIIVEDNFEKLVVLFCPRYQYCLLSSVLKWIGRMRLDRIPDFIVYSENMAWQKQFFYA